METPKPITVASLWWSASISPKSAGCLARGYLNTHSTLQSPTSNKAVQTGYSTSQRGWLHIICSPYKRATKGVYLSTFVTGRLSRSRIQQAAALVIHCTAVEHTPPCIGLGFKQPFARSTVEIHVCTGYAAHPCPGSRG